MIEGYRDRDGGGGGEQGNKEEEDAKDVGDDGGEEEEEKSSNENRTVRVNTIKPREQTGCQSKLNKGVFKFLKAL